MDTRRICGKSNAQLLAQHVQSVESRTTGAVCRLAQSPSDKQRRNKRHQLRDALKQQKKNGDYLNSNTSVHEVTENDQFNHLTINSLEVAAVAGQPMEDKRDEVYTYLKARVDQSKPMVDLRVKVDTDTHCPSKCTGRCSQTS